MKQIDNKHKKHYRKIIILLIIIVLDVVSANIFIPKSRLYNDFRTKHSYYHHSLLPYQQCKTNINIQNQRVANILDIPYIESSDYFVNTNSLGFIDESMREVDLTCEKERLLFIGGSFVEGYGCAFDKTFFGILSTMYDENKYDLLNAGVVAYSPKLIFLKTKYLLEVLYLHVDKLIVFSNTFEIADEIIYDSFTPRLDKSDLRHSRITTKIKNIINRNSFLYYTISEMYKGNNLLQNSSEPTQTVPLCEDVWPTKEHFKNERMYWEDNPHFEKWGKKGYELAEKYITALFELCKKHNIEITAVSHPIFEEIRDKHVECLYSKLWEKYCKKFNANYLNLYPLFMMNDLSPEGTIKKYYITVDGHWNEEGHRLIADFLYNHLNLE